MKKVTAIFDIGETNKKFFLFDQKFQVVEKDYTHFEEIENEEDDSINNLEAIENWIKQKVTKTLKDKRYEVTAINFSTYGASLVYIGKNGKPLTPLYDSTKSYPPTLLDDFYDKYGDELTITQETASLFLGMLNAGLQIYWLKHTQPKIFKQVRYILHFPQYLSYLFTNIPVSEYTSIGCHTCLWNYRKQDYHQWVYAEKIDELLPPIVKSNTAIHLEYLGKKIKIGVGIHDSSAALLPYLKAEEKPFLLISTGTWSITINPYNQAYLTIQDLKNDTLNYMGIDGKPVKAARLFLGNEYKLQVQKLIDYYQKHYDYHKSVGFDEAIYEKLNTNYQRYFHFEVINLKREQPETTDLSSFKNLKTAYHQLMMELVELQIEVAKRAIGNTSIQKVYIDGQFIDSEIYVTLIARHFKNYKIRTAQSPIGSALGAAIVISDEKLGRKFLKKQYRMRKV